LNTYSNKSSSLTRRWHSLSTGQAILDEISLFILVVFLD
jgi:hypothetical protein